MVSSLLLILQVMRAYFPSILALAQSLLRSPEPCVVSFGGNMYLHSFAAFDSYCQQVGFFCCCLFFVFFSNFSYFFQSKLRRVQPFGMLCCI